MTDEDIKIAFKEAVESIDCPRVIATGEPVGNSLAKGSLEFLEKGGHLEAGYVQAYKASLTEGVDNTARGIY